MKIQKGLFAKITLVVAVIMACEGCEEPLLKAKMELRVVNVSENAATVVAAVIPNQPGTILYWRYKEAGGNYFPSRPVSGEFEGLDTVKVTLDIDNLKANTSYTVQVIADNAAGAVSKETSFISGQLMAKIGLRKAEAVTLSSAKLTAWVIPNQVATELVFEYKQTASSDWINHPLSGSFSGNDSVKVSLDLSDLEANTAYHFRIKAKNLAGESISEETVFKTYAVSDIDGNYYYEVKIGNQVWLESNLKTTRFANGDPIPNIKPDEEWNAMTSPAYCYYNNDPKLGEVYGALYNHYVATDLRALIPGWRVPNLQDFETLIDYLGGEHASNSKIKSATDDWYKGGKGNNSSGFNALPGGARGKDDTFSSLTYSAVFLMSTVWGEYNYEISFHYLSYTGAMVGISPLYKGRSVRLIKE